MEALSTGLGPTVDRAIQMASERIMQASALPVSELNPQCAVLMAYQNGKDE